MAYLDYQDLTRLIADQGTTETARRLGRMLRDREVNHRQFSIKQVCEAFCGREFVDNLHPKRGSSNIVAQLQEADAVRYSDFSNITGQIMFSAIMEGYEDEEFIFSKAIPQKESNILDIEKVPQITRLGEETLVVPEGGEYPEAGVSENYIEVAAKKKRGFKVSVTKEAIIGDKTGELTQRASEGGYWVGLAKEERICDAIIDANTGAASIQQGGHRYHWKGTSYATYQTSSPWDNVAAGAAMTDYTDFDEVWQTFAAITDPFTGKPIRISPDTVIVTNELVWNATRLLRSSEARQGDTTSSTAAQHIGPNPITVVLNNLKLLSSRLLTQRVSSASQDASDWYMCNMKAWAYFRIWDITTAQRGANTDADFDRDIVQQYKASEMGCVATMDPRLTVRADAA